MYLESTMASSPLNSRCRISCWIHLACVFSSNLALLFPAVQSIESNDGVDLTLLVANVLFRHGERTPLAPYPNDPHQADIWTEGLGQLTEKGKLDEYSLGVFLRYKYKDFLDEQFNENQTSVQCTDLKRTFDSANWALTGIYPNETDKPWLSVIYHMPPGKEILNPTQYVCDYYSQLFADVRHSSNYKQFIIDNEDVLKNISEKAGYNCSTTLMVDKCYIFVDAVKIEIVYNLTQPGWITDDLIASADEIARQNYYFVLGGSTDIIRLKGGPPLQQILENMESGYYSHEHNKMKRFYIYSAHDTTIIALRYALGIYDVSVPPLSSCLGLELWKDNQNERYVKIWYSNDSIAEPYVMSLPGCNAACPLNEFKRLIKDVLPGDMKQACTVQSRWPKYIGIVCCFLSVVIVCVVVAVVCIYKMNSKKKSAEYHELSEDPETPLIDKTESGVP